MTASNWGQSVGSEVKCLRCGVRNSADARYCLHCGWPLGMPVCPSCETQNDIGAVHCTNCGASLIPTQSTGATSAVIPAVPVNNLGYLFALGSLVILPPLLGLIAFIIGIINLARGHVGPGIAQIILSIVCSLIGMGLGIASVM